MLSDKLCRTLPRETRDGDRGGDGPGGKPRAAGSPSQVGVSQPRARPTGPPVVPDPLPCAHRPARPCPARLSPHLFRVTSPGIGSALSSATGLRTGAARRAPRGCSPSAGAHPRPGSLGGSNREMLGFSRSGSQTPFAPACPSSGFSQAKSCQRSTRHLVCVELEGQKLQSGGVPPGCPLQCPPCQGESPGFGFFKEGPCGGGGSRWGQRAQLLAPPQPRQPPLLRAGRSVKISSSVFCSQKYMR